MKNRRLILLMLLFSGAATAQVNWSLSSNFVSAAEAGGTGLGLADPVVRNIQEDGKGRMWFATPKGVSCYDGKTFKSYLNAPADSLLWKDWGCHFLTADATGRIWLATNYNLFYFDEKKDRFLEYDLSGVETEAPIGNVYLQDWPEEGAAWLYIYNGVYAIDAQTLKIRKVFGLPRLAGLNGRDGDGLIWEGGWSTKKIHLLRLDGTVQQKTTAPMGHIRGVFQEPGSSRVWVGSDMLLSFDKKTGNWERWSERRHRLQFLEGMKLVPKLTGDSIMWLYPIGNPMIFGFSLRQRKFVWQHSTERFGANDLRCGGLECTYVDSKGNLWMSGNHGVSVLFTDRNQANYWSSLAAPPPIENTQIPYLAISGTWNMPDGSLAEWVSWRNNHWYVALSEHSKAYFEGISKNGAIEGKRTYINLITGERKVSKIIYRTDAKRNWTESVQGTNETCEMVGRSLFESNIIVCNAPKSDISGTWSDGSEPSYWFADGDFLVSISPEHILRCKKKGPSKWIGDCSRFFGNCETVLHFEHEVLQDGLIESSWRALDSSCDLGLGQNGKVEFKKYISKSLSSDSVLIDNFRITDEIQLINIADYQEKEFNLSYDKNYVSFDFSSTSDLTSTTFYYKLEGFDKGWFTARMQHSATYTNLDGGSYIFKVRATDAEGNELRGNAQFMLRVRQPFYKTWWFICLAASLFFGLIWFIFQVRLRQRLEKEDIRRRIARDLHDEVGSTLTTISILSESVLRQMDLDGEKTRLGGIGEKARTAMSSMSDIVWSVNPQNDNMDKIVERMIRFAADTLEPLGISAIFDIEKEVYALQLPMEQRKDFYLFFKEATTNVAKHSGAHRAVFSLKKTGRQLHFTIEDDGKGLPTQPQGSLGGNGWHNMRARAAALGAQLEIKSGENRGVRVSLRMPTA